eukprot:Gb_12628 [translate_table: standard]
MIMMKQLRGHRFVLTFVLLTFLSAAGAHNITQILNEYPQFSIFNEYLSQTKLADEINSRSAITILAVQNVATSALTKKNVEFEFVKKVLSLHVLLDYFDLTKLHQISGGTILTTTLYQTTGLAQGRTGFLNITGLKGGTVRFGSAQGSKLDAILVRSIKEEPYNISVLQISRLIIPSTFMASQPAGNVDITSILINAGHKMFAQLLSNTGVLKTYEDSMNGGLTLFAPTDEAFGSVSEKINRLSCIQKISILQLHAVPDYKPLATLKTSKGPMNTLADNGVSRYTLSMTFSGDTLFVNTGVNRAMITSVLADEPPVVIFSIDKVLDPSNIFGVAPASAPEPARAPLAPSPSPAQSPASAMTPTRSPASPPVSTPSTSASGPPLRFSPPASPTSPAPTSEYSSAGLTGKFNAVSVVISLLCGAVML